MPKSSGQEKDPYSLEGIVTERQVDVVYKALDLEIPKGSVKLSTFDTHVDLFNRLAASLKYPKDSFEIWIVFKSAQREIPVRPNVNRIIVTPTGSPLELDPRPWDQGPLHWHQGNLSSFIILIILIQRFIILQWQHKLKVNTITEEGAAAHQDHPAQSCPKEKDQKEGCRIISKRAVDKPHKMEDIIKQRQREEEERRSKKIFDDMQKKRDAEKRAEDDKRRQTIKSWEKEVEDVNDGVPCTPSNPKGNGDKTPKGQQKKKRPPVNRSKARNGNGQGRAKSRGKSKKGSTSFPLSKPSQRVSMRVPLPTAEPGRRGTLVGDDAAAELLQKFEPADQERYELYANLHGYEAAIEQMQRDLEAPPTRPDSGASPSTESASISSRSRERGDGTSGPGHPVPQASASRRRKVKGVKIHIDELAHIDLDSVAPKSQERPPQDDSTDGLLALAMSQSIEEHQQ